MVSYELTKEYHNKIIGISYGSNLSPNGEVEGPFFYKFGRATIITKDEMKLEFLNGGSITIDLKLILKIEERGNRNGKR